MVLKSVTYNCFHKIERRGTPRFPLKNHASLGYKQDSRKLFDRVVLTICGEYIPSACFRFYWSSWLLQ
jgi:hypothetical protein